MNNKQRVQRLLNNYMQKAFMAAGLKWDGDNSVEISLLVDLIYEDMERRIREHVNEYPNPHGK